MKRQAGFALPVVLIALVGAMAVALAVTQTAALERLSSRAQAGAAGEFLVVDAAVEAFAASLGPQPLDWEAGPEVVVRPGGGAEVIVSLTRLAQWQTADGSVVRVFAVAGRQEARSRAVVRLLRDSVPPADSAGMRVPVLVSSRLGWFEAVR